MKNHEAEVILLGDSNIPSELLTPSMGTSYLLEGYEDMMYGAGILDAGRGLATPAESGFVAVPTGLAKGASEFMNLDDMTREASQLVDHSWLSDAFQDVERLPVSPVDKSLGELEQLWGQNRVTDGTKFFDRDLAHEKAASEEEPSHRYNERDLFQVVSSAMRRSAMRHPLKDILVQAGGELGNEAYRIREAMVRLKDEHGLTGNVFLRLAAYPGWEQGKWLSHVKKFAFGAKYLVAPPEMIRSATWIQNGRCALTGKTVVASVPWDEAYEVYAPKLLLSGKKLATGQKREALRAAFLAQPENKIASGENLPRQVNPADTVSLKEARQAVQNVGPRQVLSPEMKREASVRAALKSKLSSMAEAGLLSPLDRDRLSLASDPVLALKEAASLAGMPVKALYEGASFSAHAGEAQIQQFENSGASWAQRQASEQARRVEVSVQKVKKAFESGIRGEALKNVILRTVQPEDVRLASKILDPFLKKTGALIERDASRTYEGVQFASHVSEKTASEVSPSMVKSAVRWTLRAMNEGAAGEELDSLIQNRFSNSLIKAAASEIESLRREHEGGAGFIYVEAAAYASNGEKGCEEGALKHRANNLKAVTAMAQCGSCVHARQMMDGTSRCALYNKTLIKASDFGPQLEGLKAANIRSVGMTDQERTASLFASSYNPSEFNLHNASLENFDYLPLPENEKVSSVSFGGFHLTPTE
jgi:hypothetical protein